MESQGPSASRAQVEAFGRRHRTGLVTLLFTDMVDSTALKQQLGDRAGAQLIEQHHALVRSTLKQFPDGEELSATGDSFFLVFATPSAGVEFALVLQQRLRELSRGAAVPTRDRMGLHLGEVLIQEAEQQRTKDLIGLNVDLGARVMRLAQGGQILLTRAVFDSARQALKGEDIAGVGQLSWLNHGPYQLKGIEEAVEICEVGEVGAGPLRSPATTEKARRVEAPEGEPVLGWRPGVGQVVPGTAWGLEEKLGEGGFGEVWLGRHQRLKELRVFKFCFRADRVRGLKREMTLFRVLRERVGEHPHIVRLLEVNLEQAPYYLEEEYVAGRDLRTWCLAQGGADKVPLEMRLEIVAQAAEGLAAAHAAGIIHRDVKPGNILVRGRSRGDEALTSSAGVAAGKNEPPHVGCYGIVVKLTDFGIGQVVSAEYLAGVTATGFTQTILASTSSSRAGTHLYMAPELLAGRPATVRSDIYSLGVLLYQLVAGDLGRPVTTEWVEDITDAILREDIKRCLTGRLEERLGNAGELAWDLRSLPERRATRAVAAKAAFERGAAKVVSLAVLPFVNMSTDPENEFLSDGIAEDLLTALSRVAGLRVPGRTSCFVFKGKTQDLRAIGQMLNVETVLEGSVRKAANRLRVSAQLINVADGFHLWSERYDREMAEVFAVQDEITQAIVAALMPKLAAEQPAIRVKPYGGNVEAYELCLRGRYHYQKRTPDGFAMALRLFEQALESDTNHPLAYSGLAEVYRLLSHFGGLPPRQGMPKAKAAALRAIELDDTLAEAHVHLANILYFYDWDWAGAEREFQRALALEPQSAEARMSYGFFLWARLRYDQALAELQKAAELDPFSSQTTWLLAWPLVSLGRYDEVLDLARKLLAMDPVFWGSHHTSASAKWQKGMRAEAIQDFEKAAALQRGPVGLGVLCLFYGRAGKLSEAQQVLEQLQQMAQQRYVQPVWLAWAYDAVGAKDQARACIQRAIEEHDPALVHLRGWRGWYPGFLEDCLPLLEKAGL